MSWASIGSGVRPPPVPGINIHSHLSCGMMHWPSPATDPALQREQGETGLGKY